MQEVAPCRCLCPSSVLEKPTTTATTTNQKNMAPAGALHFRLPLHCSLTFRQTSPYTPIMAPIIWRPSLCRCKKDIEVLIPDAGHVSEQDIEFTICGECSGVFPNTHEDVW